VENGQEALVKIKELIPKGASVMNGASVTLEQIGFVDYLKGDEHGWNNLHEAIIAEKDPAKQALLRKQSVLSDYYLGSVHALAETGEFVIASNSGSQLPHIVFTSSNLIFVVSTKKITPSLPEAMKRLMEHVIPLEDVHMKEKYGVGTAPNKILIYNDENPTVGRKIRMILVNEDLGF
jgi:L-lactate utilization protein LutC